MSNACTWSIEEGVGIITIDSPPVNALSARVRRGLHEAFRALAADDAVEAVVLICAGRTFSAGADIGELGKPMEGPGLLEVFDTIETGTRPVVAAIHGTALGGGYEFALICHYRIAVPSAKVGLPEVNLGLLPGGGGTQRLPRLIGAGPALEMLITGRTISPEEAQSIGLVSKVFADQAGFDAHVEGLRALPPLSFANIKRAVFEGMEKPLGDALALERDLMEELFNTSDAREGVTAFSEKRSPEFTGS
jgi:enoyl-CoA hydratase/carnithine racemase